MLLHTHDGNAVTTANPLPVQLTGTELWASYKGLRFKITLERVE